MRKIKRSAIIAAAVCAAGLVAAGSASASASPQVIGGQIEACGVTDPSAGSTVAVIFIGTVNGKYKQTSIQAFGSDHCTTSPPFDLGSRVQINLYDNTNPNTGYVGYRYVNDDSTGTTRVYVF